MSKIAIKGHATRGKEVIQILEMLGGKNVYNLSGYTNYAYYVIENSEIRCDIYIYGDEPYTIFTLEKFLEKYSYKVGDYARLSRTNIAVIIEEMKWENNEVVYQLSCSDDWWSVDNLKQYKEETMEEPKELLIGFTKDSDGNWVLNTHKDYEIKEVGGKFKLIQKQPQYPKIYEECCEVLGIEEDLWFVYEDIDANHINPACISNYRMRGLDLYHNLEKLIICRDAYWKIAGEEMGLGKPWEPDYKNPDIDLYVIINIYNQVEKAKYGYGFQQCVLTFPTEEM